MLHPLRPHSERPAISHHTTIARALHTFQSRLVISASGAESHPQNHHFLSAPVNLETLDSIEDADF